MEIVESLWKISALSVVKALFHNGSRHIPFESGCNFRVWWQKPHTNSTYRLWLTLQRSKWFTSLCKR